MTEVKRVEKEDMLAGVMSKKGANTAKLICMLQKGREKKGSEFFGSLRTTFEELFYEKRSRRRTKEKKKKKIMMEKAVH